MTWLAFKGAEQTSGSGSVTQIPLGRILTGLEEYFACTPINLAHVFNAISAAL